MLMKCYYHLHSSIESNNDFANYRMDDDNNWDILKITIENIELPEEFVKRELLVFRHYKVHVKEINVPFNGGRNMKPCFP
jgi:hypothetical protein